MSGAQAETRHANARQKPIRSRKKNGNRKIGQKEFEDAEQESPSKELATLQESDESQPPFEGTGHPSMTCRAIEGQTLVMPKVPVGVAMNDGPAEGNDLPQVQEQDQDIPDLSARPMKQNYRKRLSRGGDRYSPRPVSDRNRTSQIHSNDSRSTCEGSQASQSSSISHFESGNGKTSSCSTPSLGSGRNEDDHLGSKRGQLTKIKNGPGIFKRGLILETESRDWRDNGELYQKRRPWVVVETRKDQYRFGAVPIISYEGKGSGRSGKRYAAHHCIVYEGDSPPQSLPDETELLKPPARMIKKTVSVYDNPLRSSSRINLARLEFFDYRTPAAILGEIHWESFKSLMKHFENVQAEVKAENARNDEQDEERLRRSQWLTGLQKRTQRLVHEVEQRDRPS